MTARPFGPATVPAPAPARSLASPASQALVAVTVAVAFAALADRAGAPVWFAAPTAALLVGIVLGVQLDLRRWFTGVPGLVAGLATLVVLSLLWGVALGWLAVELPYPMVPLAALVVLGADWWWVERLRPLTVLSGLVLVGLLDADLTAALPLALAWFAVAAAALWSLRRDADRALPAPVPLAGAAGSAPEPGAGQTAMAVVASWLVAGAVVALVGLIPTWFESPEVDGRLSPVAPSVGSGSGSGSGSEGDRGSGGDIGPGGEADEGIRDALPGNDVDGDGIADRDIDGDGTPDVDLDGDGVPDIDRDGDGAPDETPEPGAAGDPTGSAPDPSTGAAGPGSDTSGRDGAARVLRVVAVLFVALLAAALVAVAVRAVARERARRRARAARPWAVRLAERLDHEGARRGRARHRDEPVTRYATALAGDVLHHDRLGDVGAALSAALFGAGPPSEATGTWAAQVLDEAVAANPPPRWSDPIRARLRRGRPGR